MTTLYLVHDASRPRRLPLTRGDCIDAPRPCPHTSCRHHLTAGEYDDGAHLHGRVGQVSRTESCSLDLADGGPMTLLEIGDLLGVSRERVRQIEERAVELMKMRLPRFGVTTAVEER